MHLFAEASSGSELFGWIVVIFIMWLGIRGWCKVFTTSPLARKGAKKGGLWLLSILFKK
jgi:hypothetical protein